MRVIDVRLASESDGPVLARIDLATWGPAVSPAPPPTAGGRYLFFGDQTKPSDVLVAELDGIVVGGSRCRPRRRSRTRM